MAKIKKSKEPYVAVKTYLREHPRDLKAIGDYFEEIRALNDDVEAKVFLRSANRLLRNPDLEFKDRQKLHSLVKNGNLFLAPRWFHNFMIYLEWDREPKKRFYQPRVKALKPIVDNMQDLSDGKIEILSLSMPPGTGKSTLALFYLAFEGGKHPDLPNLGCSHNAAFLKGLYDELLRIVDPEGEYLYNDVFPTSPLVNTNAKDLRIDLQSEKRFETFEFTSVGAGNAGKVRAMNLLYCDDLVDGIETALSITQLDKLWGQYYTDLRQRKQGDACKELHIATRWSVHDVIGRTYGFARNFEPFGVNNVTGFIGPETIYDGKEMIRGNLEDHFMAKIIGLPMGMAPCFTNHTGITQDDQEIACLLLNAANCNYYMGVPMGDDVMLAYQDVSFHDDNTMRELSHRKPAPEFHQWAMKMGILDEEGRLGERAGDASMFFAK